MLYVKPQTAKPPPWASILGREDFFPVLETIISCCKIIEKIFRHLSVAYHKSRFPVTIFLGRANQFLRQPHKILLER